MQVEFEVVAAVAAAAVEVEVEVLDLGLDLAEGLGFVGLGVMELLVGRLLGEV